MHKDQIISQLIQEKKLSLSHLTNHSLTQVGCFLQFTPTLG